MTKTAVKEKLSKMEAEIRLLKKAVAERPNFDIDEINWKKIKPIAKTARAKMYKKYYGKA
jgi:hypothetical protein